MPEKPNQRILLTKTLLKNSLLELLQTETIQKVSIKQICQNAQINRSTFYKYYGSQYDLLQEIGQDTVEQIVSILRQHLERQTNPQNAMLEVCRYLEQHFAALQPLVQNDPEFVHTLWGHPTIRNVLRISISPSWDPELEEYILDYIAAGIAQVVQLWMSRENRESPEQMAALLIRLILAGLQGAQLDKPPVCG